MSHIATAELARLTGYEKRHVQRLAVAGQIPGAVRTDGGHWRVPDSPEVRKWCQAVKRARVLSAVPKRVGRAGHDNYGPHLARLLTALRKTLPHMNRQNLAALQEDLSQIDDVIEPYRFGSVPTARSRASS